VLTPARRRGIEILDDPAVDAEVRTRAIGDVTRSNRWLGGLRAAVAELRRILPALGPDATLLDVGTGLADIPRHGTSVAWVPSTRWATLIASRHTALKAQRGTKIRRMRLRTTSPTGLRSADFANRLPVTKNMVGTAATT